MLVIFLLFLPCSACLFMLASFLFQGGTSRIFSPLALLYFIAMLYFYVDACWVCPILNTQIPFSALEIVGKFAGLVVIPLFYIWVRKTWNDRPLPHVYYLLFALPLVLLGSQITLFSMMGWSNSEIFLHRMFVNPSLDNIRGDGYDILLGRTYLEICYYFYNAVQGLEALLMLFLIIKNIAMHLKNLEWSGTARQLMISDIACIIVMVVIIVRVSLGVSYLTDHWELSALFSVVIAAAIFCIGTSANAINALETSMIPESVSDEMESSYENSLKQGFERLMQQQVYLDRKLTIEKVSGMLHTNRTYLSRMIKDEYGCTFKDYITDRRLSFVKTYMLQHPDEKMDSISVAAGFADASHLTKRFKDQEGLTPKQWLDSRL